MKFQRRFCVRAPLTAVAGFHSQADSIGAITPPFIPLQMEQTPPCLAAGDEMRFRMWLGPLPVVWQAYIGQVSSSGFTDHQLAGPFRYWMHRHTFEPVDAATTEVVDQVQAGLRWHALWGPVGLAIWLGLPLLFAYRRWKTRRVLEGVLNQ